MEEVPADLAQEHRVATDLVVRIGRGDRRAETEMVQRYGRGLLYLLRRNAGAVDLADDLWQDTFRVAIEKLRQSDIKEPAKLAGYLRGIATHLLTGDIRKRQRRRTTARSDLLDNVADSGTDPVMEISRDQIRSMVRQLLGELPVERDRQILLRYYVYDQDKSEICGDLQLESLHFNRVLFRAKQRFHNLLIQAQKKHHLKVVQ